MYIVHTGVKFRNKIENKWVAFFACLITRALPLECLTSQATEAFLMALIVLFQEEKSQKEYYPTKNNIQLRWNFIALWILAGNFKVTLTKLKDKRPLSTTGFKVLNLSHKSDIKHPSENQRVWRLTASNRLTFDFPDKNSTDFVKTKKKGLIKDSHSRHQVKTNILTSFAKPIESKIWNAPLNATKKEASKKIIFV